MKIIEYNDKIVKEEDLWLNRYMPLKSWKYWFKNKTFYLGFSRIDQFNDTLEGIENSSPELHRAWQMFLNYSKRGINSGGDIESGKNVISFLAKLQNSNESNKIISEFEKYLNIIESNYASCWFMSERPEEEQRYMWNIYGKTPNEKAFLLSIKWIDIKSILDTSNKAFEYGKIEYSKKNSNNILFRKHWSYKHENEFRILGKDFKNEHDSIAIETDLNKIITLSEPVSSEKYKELQLALNQNSDEIRYSNLPMQWNLNEIKELL